MYNLSTPEQKNKTIAKLLKDGKTLFENKNLVVTHLLVNGKLATWIQNGSQSSLVYITKLAERYWLCKTEIVREPIVKIEFLPDQNIYNNLN